jgi:heme-degrading monooxygenase HmoA
MIVLQIQLTPRTGQEKMLEEAISQRFLPAMSRQPGFLRCFLSRPYPEDRLAVVGAKRPSYQFQVTALWKSEEERQAWVTRDIHQEVWGEVSGLSAQASSLLLDVVQTWSF